MNAMSCDAWILLGYTLIMWSGIGAIGLWCLRHRQWSEQPRARYLPLTARIERQPGNSSMADDKQQQGGGQTGVFRH